MESVARIGAYAVDIATGRWVSTKGLDAILGIDDSFDRSLVGWASLVHPAERDAMLAYFGDEVVDRGQPFDRQYRIVRADSGVGRWVHGRGQLDLDAAGRPVRMFGTIADITDQRGAQDALTASELRYATIFEGTAEAILIAEVPTRRMRWVNSAACALLGYSREELLQLTVDDIHPASALPIVLDGFGKRSMGVVSAHRSVPCLRKDGTLLLVDIRASRSVMEGVACNIAFFTDVTDRVAAEEQRSRLEESLRANERNLAEAQKIAHIGSWAWDLATDTALRSDELHRIYGVEPGSIPATTEAFHDFIHPDDRARVHASERAALTSGGQYALDYRAVRPDGEVRVLHDEARVIHDPSGAPVRMIGTVQDITERVAADEERARLTAVVDQTSDSVMIADLAGMIQYVNPAFERVSGYRRDEVIGQNPRILKSGRQSITFYRAMWRRLLRGDVWAGALVNRRKDGFLYREEATISPLRGADGKVAGYVAVKRDVTALRDAESRLAREFRERAELNAALTHLRPGSSPEETGAAICDELVGLQGVDLATIFNFPRPHLAVTVAVAGPDGLPLSPGRPLPAPRASYLYERAMQGPWAEEWQPRPIDGSYSQSIADLGIKAVAYAPIHYGGQLIGLLATGTRDGAYVRHLVDHLPAVGEFAAAAGALLHGQLEQLNSAEQVRTRVRRALTTGNLMPVFQPIRDLASGEVVGYEALTRFADGTPPDEMIAAAHSVGMGLELEVGCITAALAASVSLPSHVWLSLNASPEVILHSADLAHLLVGRERRLVLEVTEHAEIRDYPAFGRALAAFGPRVRLAVDDAGAGFASLRHVVELRPQFLKVDISLVRQADADMTRQAMIAGLRHFAERAGCEVIAEGIEEQAELEILRELGVSLGQGYLLGRPEPLRAAPERAQRGARPIRPPAKTKRRRPARAGATSRS